MYLHPGVHVPTESQTLYLSFETLAHYTLTYSTQIANNLIKGYYVDINMSKSLNVD